MVDGRTTDGRTDDDGRRLEGYTLSSPCEPKGSGELKRGECRCRGLDLTQNHLKIEKKTKKKKKSGEKNLWSERDLNPRPSDYKSCT